MKAILVLPLLFALSLTAASASTPPQVRVFDHSEAQSLKAGVDPFGGARITYQGELVNNGAAVNEIVALRFVFFEGQASTLPADELGTTIILNVPVIGGRFTTVVPLAYLPDFRDTHLRVSVKRPSDPDFVLLGAQSIAPVPRASFADRAGTAAFADLPWSLMPSNRIAFLGERVGVGLTDPAAKLELLSGVGSLPGLIVRNTAIGSNNALGASFQVAGEGFGGSSAVAVQAHASAGSGSTMGLSARSDSGSGIGAFVIASADTGASLGVLARNNSAQGVAVDAWAAASSGSPTALRARVNSVDAFAARFEGGITYVGGDLGVGVAAPSARVHIAGGAGATPLQVAVNGSTRMQVHTNGGMSVGSSTTPPALGLHVNGPIRMPPRTLWYSVSGKAFVAEQTENVDVRSWNQDGLAALASGGTDVYFTAPLILPQGVEITELSALVTDLAAVENITLQIVRRSHADAGFAVLASVSSSAAILGKQTLVDSSITVPDVNNEHYVYDLRASWRVPVSGSPFDIRLNTVRVAYTIDSPLP